MAAGSVYSRLEKDYEIQCDDASDLVSVTDFKRRCGELYHDVVGAHVSSEEDHVTFPPEIAAICKYVYMSNSVCMSKFCSFCSNQHRFAAGKQQNLVCIFLPPLLVSVQPAGGLEQYMKGKKTQLKDTPLHCLKYIQWNHSMRTPLN